MSFFRYADVFSDDMENDPSTAEDKFVPDWDIRNKDSVMDELIARTFLFNIGTPIDHARSWKMKSQDLGATVLSNQAQSNIFVTELYRRWVESESVREELKKEVRFLKRKVQKTPEAESKIAQLTTELQTHQEKIKSLMIQNQSFQAAAASAAEERDRVSTELKKFSESMRKQDEEHKLVIVMMEESFNNAGLAYANMMAERDMLKTGEADLKAQIEDLKSTHEAEIEGVKKENAALRASVDDLYATKSWLISEGAQLLAKNIHKGRERTAAVAVVNNAMSAVGVNSGLHNGYLHALKLKTPYSEVPLLNRNAAEELNAVVACFDTLTFPVIEDLPRLTDAPLSKIKDALSFASSGSSEK
ncbi:putative transcription factor bZIP family [Helianthus anomalus]